MVNSFSESDTIATATLCDAFTHGEMGPERCTVCSSVVKYVHLTDFQPCLYGTKHCSPRDHITCSNGSCKNFRKIFICFECVKPSGVFTHLKEYEKTDDMAILNVRDGVYQPLMHNSSFELFLHMRNYLDGEDINNLVFYENGAGKLQVSLIASLLGFKAVVAVEIDTTMSKAVINRFCAIDLHRVVLLNEDSCNMGPCKGCIKFLFYIQTITLYLPPFRSH